MSDQEENIKQLIQNIFSDKYDSDSLHFAYRTIFDIAEENLSLAPHVFKAIEHTLKAQEHSPDSLIDIYFFVSEAVATDSTLSDKGLLLFAKALHSSQNSEESFLRAAFRLKYIIKNNPNLAPKVLNIAEHMIKKYPNKEIITDTFYKLLDELVHQQPKFAQQILHSIAHQLCSEAALNTAKNCMRHLSFDDIKADFPDFSEKITVAYKGRFSSNAEFKYALENINIERLTQTNAFSAQQRAMNVLVGLYAKEQKIDQQKAMDYRKPNVSPDIKRWYLSNEHWLIEGSFKGSQIFGCYFPTYLRKTQSYLSTKDAVEWLPDLMDPQKNESFAKFIMHNIVYNKDGQDYLRSLSELKIIAKGWKNLPFEQEKGKYQSVLGACLAQRFTDFKSLVFATEAAKHKTPLSEYHDCEDIYLASLKVPEPFDSTKEFKRGKYTGKFLPRNDPRVGFFGNYTDCCQHFSALGQTCAISSMKDPFSQLFVVENEKGRIVAGSWVWENTEGKYREVCFDNIEAIGKFKNHAVISAIYDDVGFYLAQECNCRRVTIGKGHEDFDLSDYPSTSPIQLPHLYGNEYSDADAQVLLAENINAKPLNQSDKHECYVRDACFSDEEAIDSIREQLFERFYSYEIFDNSGLILEDKQKLIGGYILYDKKAKEIRDISFSEKFDKNTNNSVSKLFLEMIKIVQQEGGQWTVKIEDKQTFDYIKALENQNIIQTDRKLSNLVFQKDQNYDICFTAVAQDLSKNTTNLKATQQSFSNQSELSLLSLHRFLSKPYQ